MAITVPPDMLAAAEEAAGALSGGPNMVRAILAQWGCENRWVWPPPDNNPANIKVTSLSSNGITAGYTQGRAAADGGFFAHFAAWDPEGLAGYITYFTKSPLYTAGIDAAAKDDAATFMASVSHGGTSLTCMTGVYRDLAGQAATASHPLVHPNVADYLALDPSTPFTDAIAARAAGKFAQDNVPTGGPAHAGAYGAIYTALKAWELPGVTAGEVPFNVAQGGQPTGSVVVPSPSQSASGDTQRGSVVPDVAGAIGALPAAIVNTLLPPVESFFESIAVNLAILLLVIFLARRGIEQLLGG